MSTSHPTILISQKENYDTLCGNDAAAELVQDKARFTEILRAIGHGITWHETSPLHGVIKPPLARGSVVEQALAAYGLSSAISGQEANPEEADITIFLPEALAKTSFLGEIELDLVSLHENERA